MTAEDVLLSDGKYHTVLLGLLGYAGPGFYALDVTNPRRPAVYVGRGKRHIQPQGRRSALKPEYRVVRILLEAQSGVPLPARIPCTRI